MTDKRIKVSELAPGNLVDLEGDKYADPRHEHVMLQSQYVEVVSIEQETPHCVAVGFEGFDVVGFPPDHMVPVSEDMGDMGDHDA